MPNFILMPDPIILGARGVLVPPLEKLISLAGQKLELGRTEMGAWQDRNGKLGKRLLVKILILQLFLSFFVWFLPLLVGFCHISLFFLHFCLFCSHLSFISAHWQDSLVEKLGTAAWQNTWPPLAGRNFGRKGLNFGRMKLLAPPKK